MIITALITARIGSERLKMKNLALINGKPMIYYAIKAAKDSNIFNRVVINSDNIIFKKIAIRYGVDFYLRPKRLGASDINIDDVVMDFIENNRSDIVAIVNTPSPLQTGKEVTQGIQYFLDNKLDSMISVRENFIHGIFNNSPINFSFKEPFQKTQNLIPIDLLIYSLMVWKTDVFSKAYKKNGYALFCGKSGFFKASKESSFLVKTEEDLILVNQIIQSNKKEIEYDDLIKEI